MILLDALNIAYWCGPPARLCLPQALWEALRAHSQDAVWVLDASARYHWPADALDYAALLAAHPEHIREVPKGEIADVTLLRMARDSGAVIVSRDRFKDHRQKFRRLIKTPGRIVGGSVQDGLLSVPALDICMPVPGLSPAPWAVPLGA